MRTMRIGTAIAAMALVAALPAAALDFEAEAFFGNIGMPWDIVTPIQGSAYPSNLWMYGGEISVVESLGEGFRLETNYVTDPVLRHVLSSLVSYEAGLVKLAVGPVLGAFNSAQTPLKAGISAGLRVDIPGLVFVSVRADSSMGAGLMTTGDYAQELGELSGGWYVRNAICTLTLATRKFYIVPSPGDVIADASNRYSFSVDVHKKGVPYRILASLGYEDFRRTYADATVDRLGTLFLGARINADIGPRLTLIFDLESGVYTFGMDALAARGPDPDAFMFRASIGFRLTLGASEADTIPELPPIPESFAPEETPPAETPPTDGTTTDTTLTPSTDTTLVPPTDTVTTEPAP